jgi:ankyrin repeat protein
LLDVTVEFGGYRKSPLHCAIVWRNLDIMKALLSHEADPNIEGMYEDNTPLHLAAAAGWLDGILLLLDSGASIDPTDAFLLETPLHKAARNLQAEACELLCARGADTKRRNIDGQSYHSISECAREYPDDWKVNPEVVYFLCI